MTAGNKDPSMAGPALYERIENDFYPTPEWCTQVLLRHVTFGKVWEPACGDGAISKVLVAHGLEVKSTDLVDRGYGDPESKDFLFQWDEGYDIVTNPPYGDMAEQFIRHALRVTHGVGKVAMLMRNEWDSASTRSVLYQHPYAMKIILTKRPRWIAGSTGAPRHNYAWFVWDWKHTGKPVLVHDQ